MNSFSRNPIAGILKGREPWVRDGMNSFSRNPIEGIPTVREPYVLLLYELLFKESLRSENPGSSYYMHSFSRNP
jgi:hypothetical protein